MRNYYGIIIFVVHFEQMLIFYDRADENLNFSSIIGMMVYNTKPVHYF